MGRHALMLQVFAIASNALVVQGARLHEIAAAVASTGATTPERSTDAPEGGAPVRIGALPVGDPIESMVSLKDVEQAYKMNAAVIETAGEMLDSLLDAIDPDRR